MVPLKVVSRSNEIRVSFYKGGKDPGSRNTPVTQPHSGSSPEHCRAPLEAVRVRTDCPGPKTSDLPPTTRSGAASRQTADSGFVVFVVVFFVSAARWDDVTPRDVGGQGDVAS